MHDVAVRSGTAQVDVIEQQYKATLYALGQLLDWHARINSIKVAAYCPSAPHKTTQALADAVASFEAKCDALESELLRARAVIERDQRRAAGLLPSMTKAEEASAKASGADAKDPIDLDSSLFGNEDLFGASPPQATDPSLSASTGAPFNLEALTSMPGITTSAPADPNPLSADELNALIGTLNAPAANAEAAPVADFDFANLDFDSILSQFGS